MSEVYLIICHGADSWGGAVAVVIGQDQQNNSVKLRNFGFKWKVTKSKTVNC